MTTRTPEVMIPPLIISVSWGGRTQTSSEPLKEVIYIRVNNPSLNRNIGKYHLPHIWDEVLINIPELKLK